MTLENDDEWQENRFLLRIYLSHDGESQTEISRQLLVNVFLNYFFGTKRILAIFPSETPDFRRSRQTFPELDVTNLKCFEMIFMSNEFQTVNW